MTKNNQENKKMKQTDFEQRSIRNAEEVNLLSDFHAWQYARKQEEIKKLKAKGFDNSEIVR
jgi:hypothetical protein